MKIRAVAIAAMLLLGAGGGRGQEAEAAWKALRRDHPRDPLAERAGMELAALYLKRRQFEPAAELARQVAERGLPRRGLLNVNIPFRPWADVQGVRITRLGSRKYRDTLIRRIADGLNDSGCLILVEKVLSKDSLLNRMFIKFYYDMKRRNGYSDMEIASKREALENVMIPYRIEENVELLTRNGFKEVDTFFKWYNFAGLLAVKKSST